jgi:TfoX/Sxy family transcriptional regulator of competence genes
MVRRDGDVEDEMDFDEAVAERVREVLAGSPDIVEKRMFGGVAFMVRGNMCCGVIGDRLMLRVGPKGYEAALSRPHAKTMDFTGRPMKGLVYVEPAGFASAGDLEAWIAKARGFALSLPAKRVPPGALSTTRARGRGRGGGR